MAHSQGDPCHGRWGEDRRHLRGPDEWQGRVEDGLRLGEPDERLARIEDRRRDGNRHVRRRRDRRRPGGPEE